MNFWRSFGFYTPSPIDNILERDAFELEELLAEDDISHELVSHNKNLIAYDVLENVVRYVVDAEYHLEELGEQKRNKYAGLCADILALDVWSIADGVTQHEGLLDKLYSFIELDPPLPNAVAARGSRILGALLMQKPTEVVAFMQARENALSDFIKHLSCGPVMELMLKLIKADDAVCNGEGAKGTIQWMREENLVPKLVSLMGEEHSSSVHENASGALCEIAAVASARSPLLADMMSEETAKSIFSHAFRDVSLQSSQLKHSLPLIEALISHLPEPENPDSALPAVLAMFEAHVPRIKELLSTSSGESVMCTFGELAPPFGFVRMKELFFKYEFNNMLHRLVSDLIVSALESPDLALKTAIFEECNLHKMIAVNGVTRGPGGARRGYMGFVTDLSTKIEREAEFLEAIKELLESSEEWKHYVEVELKVTKRIIYPQNGNDDDEEEHEHEPSRFSPDEEEGGPWETFGSNRGTSEAMDTQEAAGDVEQGASVVDGSDGAEADGASTADMQVEQSSVDGDGAGGEAAASSANDEEGATAMIVEEAEEGQKAVPEGGDAPGQADEGIGAEQAQAEEPKGEDGGEC